VDAYGELAAAAFHLKLLDEARENLTKALKLDPARPALFLRLGEVELAAKRPEAAIRSLKEAKRLTPLGDRRRIETTWLLIQAYDTLKDRASTCQEIAEFRRLDAVATPWAPQVEEAAERNRCKP
jgi:predicted Zn-dependent protease